jgi:hypothetical protein
LVAAGCASPPQPKPESAAAPATAAVSESAAAKPAFAPPLDDLEPDKPILPPSAAKPPAPFEGDGWEYMFDGKDLKGWKATPFAGHGQVVIVNGNLVMTMGDPFTGVNWTNPFPQMNYEIAFDAMRMIGNDFFCGLTLPMETNNFSLILGGWGGALVGISCINGMDASENETTKYKKFDTSRWYRVRVRVTAGRVEAWTDEDKIVDLVLKDRKLSLRPGDIEMSAPIGIACWQTSSVLREIKWRTVTSSADPIPKSARFQ